MKINEELLNRFEQNLNPQDLSKSKIPAQIIGYGEISTIFQIDGNEQVAFKRMPLFKTNSSAVVYEHQYREYCANLADAGLVLPEDETIILESAGNLVVLYIAQKKFSSRSVCNNLINELNYSETGQLFERIVNEIEKVWRFNERRKPAIELSIDGQLSNWIFAEDELFFIDTSTPLFRKNGIEQLDPELLLQSAPGFLRWILRLFFLDDVMNRYYDRRQVYIDLVANLYKEQHPELIPLLVEIINHYLPSEITPLTEEEIRKYYKEDKLIWTLFLFFRKIDRLLTTKLFRKRYEFILAGKIER